MGARCGKSARRVLSGGRPARAVPTGTGRRHHDDFGTPEKVPEGRMREPASRRCRARTAGEGARRADAWSGARKSAGTSGVELDVRSGRRPTSRRSIGSTPDQVDVRPRRMREPASRRFRPREKVPEGRMVAPVKAGMSKKVRMASKGTRTRQVLPQEESAPGRSTLALRRATVRGEA